MKKKLEQHHQHSQKKNDPLSLRITFPEKKRSFFTKDYKSSSKWYFELNHQKMAGVAIMCTYNPLR